MLPPSTAKWIPSNKARTREPFYDVANAALLRKSSVAPALAPTQERKGGAMSPTFVRYQRTAEAGCLFGSQLLGFALLPHELEFALFGFLGCRNLFLHLLGRFLP